MTEVWLGILSGAAFGFVIQRVGATDPEEMALGHLMQDSRIPRFMLLAVIFAAIGLFCLQAAGVGRTVILPLTVGGILVGGVLFGLGWGLAGYCPGTTWAAVGEGRMDAVFALVGGLAGTAAFAHLHAWIIPLVYAPTNLGQVTMGTLFGHPLTGLVVEIVILAAAVWLVGRLWRHGPEAS
jgi:uncharacterized membrane protein YedE/YeeE